VDALREAFPGIQTQAAATLAQARPLIERLAAACDAGTALALIDLRLPDGSGIEAVRLCGERGILPVVSTIYDDPQSLLGALHAGAHGYQLMYHLRSHLVHYLRRLGRG